MVASRRLRKTAAAARQHGCNDETVLEVEATSMDMIKQVILEQKQAIIDLVYCDHFISSLKLFDGLFPCLSLLLILKTHYDFPSDILRSLDIRCSEVVSVTPVLLLPKCPDITIFGYKTAQTAYWQWSWFSTKHIPSLSAPLDFTWYRPILGTRVGTDAPEILRTAAVVRQVK